MLNFLLLQDIKSKRKWVQLMSPDLKIMRNLQCAPKKLVIKGCFPYKMLKIGALYLNFEQSDLAKIWTLIYKYREFHLSEFHCVLACSQKVSKGCSKTK